MGAGSLSQVGSKLHAVRVINLSNQDIDVRKGQCMGLLRMDRTINFDIESPSVLSKPGNLEMSPPRVSKVTAGQCDKMPNHVNDLYERSVQQLTSEKQKRQLFDLLVKNADVFSKDATDLGKTHIVEHHIPTTTEKPVKLFPYRAPYWKKAEIDRQIQTFVDKERLPISARL